MSKVVDAGKLVSMALRQRFSTANVERTPEPTTLTQQSEEAEDFGRALESPSALLYFSALELIFRFSPSLGANSAALDMCCGPGVFAELLSSAMGIGSTVGVDLSEPMLEVGRRRSEMNPALRFEKHDVTELSAFESDRFDLVTFLYGAHHMDSIDDVQTALTEADRICADTGTIFVMDLVRFNTEDIIERYIDLSGGAYLELGLNYLHNDFMNSMYAAWAIDELAQSIPGQTQRRWFQVSPKGLPFCQILLGLPEGQGEPRNYGAVDADFVGQNLPTAFDADWRGISSWLNWLNVRRLNVPRLDA